MHEVAKVCRQCDTVGGPQATDGCMQSVIARKVLSSLCMVLASIRAPPWSMQGLSVHLYACIASNSRPLFIGAAEPLVACKPHNCLTSCDSLMATNAYLKPQGQAMQERHACCHRITLPGCMWQFCFALRKQRQLPVQIESVLLIQQTK